MVAAILICASLIPPVFILLIMFGFNYWKNIWPQDSGKAWMVILFPLVVAGLTGYSIVYHTLGFAGQLINNPVESFAVLVLMAIFFRSRVSGGFEQLKDLALWVTNSFYQRIASASHAYVVGSLEIWGAKWENALTAVFWLVILGGIYFFLSQFRNVFALPNQPDLANVPAHLAAALFIFAHVLILLLIVSLLRILMSNLRYKSILAMPRVDTFAPKKLEGPITHLKIAHLSDLHIPAKDRLTEEEPWIPEILSRCTSALDTEKDPGALDAIVISGDVTDTGHADAWETFGKHFGNHKEKTVIAPGNHDLNIVGYGIPSIFLVSDMKGRGGRWKRMQSFMDAAADIMSGRANVWTDGTFTCFKSAFGKIKSDNNLTESKKLDAAINLFPLFVSVPSAPHHTFIVWNTVRSSSLAINNSLGQISPEQLDRFKTAEKYLTNRNSTSFIHVMHHKVALPVDRLKSNRKPKQGWKPWARLLDLLTAGKQRIQISGMVMSNAHNVVEVLMKNQSSTVLLHGHHHASFFGTIARNNRELYVVSAPSTTLGTEFFNDSGDTRRGFDIVRITTSGTESVLDGRPCRKGIMPDGKG